MRGVILPELQDPTLAFVELPSVPLQPVQVWMNWQHSLLACPALLEDWGDIGFPPLLLHDLSKTHLIKDKSNLTEKLF